MKNKMSPLLLMYLFAFWVKSLRIDDYGDVNYQCIVDLDYDISRLSSSDLSRVDELSFAMILYRHGNRLPLSAITREFPNDNQQYLCDVKRVASVYSFVDGDDSASTFDVRLNTPYGQHPYPNSNCETTQISNNTVNQMITTGKIAAKRFFGNSKDQFSKQDQSPDIIYSFVSYINRIIDSQVYFLQGFLQDGNSNNNNNNNNKNNKKNFIDTEMYMYDFDPYRNDRVQSYCRANSAGFQEWYSRYQEIAQNSAAAAEYLSTPDAVAAIEAFIAEGGNNIDAIALASLGYWYCGGADIPLSEETFGDIMEVARIYFNTWDESEAAVDANQCYAHQIMRTGYYLVKERLFAALGGSEQKLYVVSSQSFPMRWFLWGLDLFEERQGVRQGEMVTLEVYKKRNDGSRGGSSSGSDSDSDSGDDSDIDTSNYLFRFTRDGDFIEYPPCSSEYENGSELCELDVLFDVFNKYGFNDAIAYSEWISLCDNAVDECWCGFCDE